MLQTYKAILRGNQIEWQGDTPDQLESDLPIDVFVTILNEVDASGNQLQRGQKMAEALSKLAALGKSSIADPSIWQREERQERGLPGRE